MIEKEVVPYWEIDELADEFTRLFQKAVEDKNQTSAEYFHNCRSCLDILKEYHYWKYNKYEPQFETTSAENPERTHRS